MTSKAVVGGAPRARRAMFCGVLALTSAAALMPDWASVLKAQGYYGDVDLKVRAIPSQPFLSAGDVVDFYVIVDNAGPDAANRARAIMGAQRLGFVTSSGCQQDPTGFPHCQLASPLNAGGTADFILRMRVPPAARGHSQLSISVTSDDDEIAPGDEVALYKGLILANVDLKSDVACETPLVQAGNTTRCSIRYRNTGTATALLPQLLSSVTGAHGAHWTCSASRPALCPAPATFVNSYTVTPQTLAAGEYVAVNVEVVTVPGQNNGPLLTIQAAAIPAADELEASPQDNRDRAFVEWGLFADNFER